MASLQPFTPTCAPIDPDRTAVLVDQLNTWFDGNGGTTDAALAILDQMRDAAGATFTAELSLYLARVGLAHMAGGNLAAAAA